MKRNPYYFLVLVISVSLILGCANQQVNELRDWAGPAKKQAESGDMKWSEYYKGYYSRVEALPQMEGKAFYLRSASTMIDTSLPMENGNITKEEFDSIRREMDAAEAEYAAGTRAITVLETEPPVPGPVLYSENFNDTGYSIPHTLNEDEVKSKFGWSYLQQAKGGNVHLVNDPFSPSQGGRGTVLKIDFKEGNYAIKKTAQRYEAGATGMQAGIWQTSGIDELYYAFDLFFPDDFIFNFSMYQAAAHGGDFHASNDPADYGKWIYGGPMFWGNNEDANAWAAQYGCGKSPTSIDGQIALYQYHSLDYQVNGWSGVPYKKGVWNRIEVQLKINTPYTASNGIARMWLDGQLIYERTNRKWRNDVKPTLQWEEVMLVFYEGGNSPCWTAPRNQSLYLDNLIISENPITH